MKTSKYKDGSVVPDAEFVAAWERIEKALGIEVDPDRPMTVCILETLADMAEQVSAHTGWIDQLEKGLQDGR